MLLAESMLLPPPRPTTKSQPVSLASAAASITCSTTGLGCTLSKTTLSTPWFFNKACTRSRYPSRLTDVPPMTIRALAPGRGAEPRLSKEPAPKKICAGMKN